ncbi:hypothetical protein QUG92_06420 [Curtobacterium sp. RHCKG23]|uniref:Uncharacterized protein n=1 Tax=Curtobacterium citri TaxID=3055139 RepID=A0ABT7T583_9MICO|nr:hypothetical protein [Curtobacterium citri]MDM7884737.1 hypothetical protein [Curtobacterium citri]
MDDAEVSGPYDNREADADAERGLLFLQFGFARRDRLDDRYQQLAVRPKSSLAGDRAAAPYNPVPDQIVNLLGAALDHLHGLQVSVESSGGTLLAMSSFTLIRSAIEVAGTGLWLLQPAARDERLLRSMRLTRENRRQLRSVLSDLGRSDPRFEVVEERLKDQATVRPSLVGADLTKLEPVTDRLRSITTMVPPRHHPPLVIWRMASGIAHGNTSMMTAVLERQQVEEFDGRSASFNVTSSFVTVSMFFDAALNMVESLLDLFDRRNDPLSVV